MVVVRETRLHKGFLELIMEGKAERNALYAEARINEIVALCEKHARNRVLVDLSGVEEVANVGILGEHIVGAFLAQPDKKAIRWAGYLTSMQSAQIAQFPYMEFVGRNRGVQISAFTDREEAIAWLLR